MSFEKNEGVFGEALRTRSRMFLGGFWVLVLRFCSCVRDWVNARLEKC